MPSNGVEDLKHIVDTKHLPTRSAFLIVACDKQMLVNALTTLSLGRFGVKDPDNAIEIRTDETSGLVTIMAVSANRIASVAPRSMPAGLSQITQSNIFRSAVITRNTPSSVRASLSRV